jgi:hypothetical protein
MISLLLACGCLLPFHLLPLPRATEGFGSYGIGGWSACKTLALVYTTWHIAYILFCPACHSGTSLNDYGHWGRVFSEYVLSFAFSTSIYMDKDFTNGRIDEGSHGMRMYQRSDYYFFFTFLGVLSSFFFFFLFFSLLLSFKREVSIFSRQSDWGSADV